MRARLNDSEETQRLGENVAGYGTRKSRLPPDTRERRVVTTAECVADALHIWSSWSTRFHVPGYATPPYPPRRLEPESHEGALAGNLNVITAESPMD